MFVVNFSLLVFLAVSVDNGLSLDCYSCLVTNSNCVDPFSDSGISKESNCKTCSKFKASDGDTNVVNRACESVSLSLGCSSTELGGVKGEICICETSLCNSGTLLKYAPMAILLSAVLSMMNVFLY